MGQHLCKYGFTPDYTRWTFHGEAHRMRDEVVRQRIDDCDADAGVGDMLHDYHEAHFGEGPQEEEQRHLQRHITRCWRRHRNHFMAIQRFLSWMALDA